MRIQLTFATFALIASLGITAPAAAQGVGSTLDAPSGTTGPVALPPPPSYGGAPAEPAEAPPRAAAGDDYAPSWGFIVPGLALLLVPYITGALAAIVVVAGGSGDEAALLFVPVVGAFYFAGQASDPDSIALFAAMGISELAGIALIVLGAAINRRAGNDDVSFAPLVGPGLAGISAAGRF